MGNRTHRRRRLEVEPPLVGFAETDVSSLFAEFALGGFNRRLVSFHGAAGEFPKRLAVVETWPIDADENQPSLFVKGNDNSGMQRAIDRPSVIGSIKGVEVAVVLGLGARSSS